MKTQCSSFLLLIIILLTLNSCIDLSDKPISPASENGDAGSLTAAPWKLSGFSVNPAVDFNGDGTIESDLYPGVDSCTKDDITIFKTDLTYSRNEGPTKCDTTAQQIFETGTWAFSEDAKNLILNNDTDSTTSIFEIVDLSATTLKLSYTQSSNGVSYTFTQTLSH
jgi:hypothetical protein